MRHQNPGEEYGLLHALTRNLTSFLFDASDEDAEPTLDTYRGFRDPDEQLRRDRRSNWRSSGPSTRAI